MPTPVVSIIIPNYNGKRWLRDCFESIKNQTFRNLEVILIDNASEDSSVDYVKVNFPWVKIIQNNKNLGFALANNQAAINARGEYLFFLNNDTKTHPKVLEFLSTKMEGDNSIGICGCKMMSYDGKTLFHSGIGVDIFGYPVARGKVFYAEGSALMIRKKLFEEIGGFDPAYFMFHEDIDLAWRVWLSGYQVAAIPEAVVYHSLGASAGGAALIKEGQYRSTYFRRYFSERNNIRTLLKNYTINYLILILPVYFLINVAEMILFLLILKPKVSWCYIKAYAWNLTNLKDTLLCRRQIQSSRKKPDKEVISKMYKGIGKFLIFKKINIPNFE